MTSLRGARTVGWPVRVGQVHIGGVGGEVSKDEAGDEGGEGGVVADGADRRLCVKQPGEASPLPKAELVWKRELGR